jgi:hypothetical protein
LHPIDKYDFETDKYLDNLFNRLQSISSNILVDLRTKKDRKSKVISVLFWVCDLNKEIK